MSTPAYTKQNDFELEDDGGFSFTVETSDGFQHTARGKLENAGTDEEELVVTGSYSYIGPDGVNYTVQKKKEPLLRGEELPPLEIGNKNSACIATLCGTGPG
ncbi:hypothetical protein NQ318_003340 [Aromia moschata]|uniref:Uncharacterized protein n=1 Tax=Aromia moschata TaxID=1265417 RepID=A0AAV8XHN4_9CUCU|nr:hypothetical protein NQ318_003340 [Aromia moschata]